MLKGEPEYDPENEEGSLFEADPLLEQPEHQLLNERIAKFWANAGDFS